MASLSGFDSLALAKVAHVRLASVFIILLVHTVRLSPLKREEYQKGLEARKSFGFN